MPRNNVDPKRLSDAWKRLFEFEKQSYTQKLPYSKELIREAIAKSEFPTISWSGGKDSTVVLHLVLQVAPNIPVIFVDLDCLFSETKKYVIELAEKWNINLHIVKSEEHTFESVTQKYGYPIFSKNIASNVERAIRTGNVRKQLSKFEVFLVRNKAKISAKCSHYLLEHPCKLKEKELNCDLKFIGLRALESRARVRLWADYGDIYPVKDYFGKKKPIIKCNPISTWSENDIWEYFKECDIPICDIYNKGYLRNGCWTCTMAIRNGQLQKLKNYRPDLYKNLIFESEMGKEIFRLKGLLEKENGYKKYIVLPE